MTEPNKDTARNFLVDNTFIGGLPDSVVDQLVACGQFRELDREQRVFERGDPGDSLQVILKGTIKICNTDVDGRESVLNFLREGDIIGEIAALDGGERTASGVAMEATSLYVLKRDDLLPILKAHPDALFEIISILCEKLRCTSDMVEHQTRTMPVRFAVGLRRLAYLHGRRTPKGIAIDLVASQRDLGGYFGMSRANTSRQISRLTALGILESDGRTLVIRDDEALRGIAETKGT